MIDKTFQQVKTLPNSIEVRKNRHMAIALDKNGQSIVDDLYIHNPRIEEAEIAHFFDTLLFVAIRVLTVGDIDDIAEDVFRNCNYEKLQFITIEPFKSYLKPKIEYAIGYFSEQLLTLGILHDLTVIRVINSTLFINY